VTNLQPSHAAKPRTIPTLRAWLPVIAWAAVLFGLSSIPGRDIPTIQFSYSDKIVHCGIYAVLGALCFRALRLTTRLGVVSAILVVPLIVLAYGVSDELHQMFVPQRSSDVFDVVADVIGGALGAVLASRWPGLRRRR
jgi:VanZ family protein